MFHLEPSPRSIEEMYKICPQKRKFDQYQFRSRSLSLNVIIKIHHDYDLFQITLKVIRTPSVDILIKRTS